MDGTCGDGITVYNPAKGNIPADKKDPGDDASISGNNMEPMAVDKDRELWVNHWGTDLTLSIPDGEFSSINTIAQTPTASAPTGSSACFADSKGYLWIGTFDKGLDLLIRKRRHLRILFTIAAGTPER